MRLTACGIEAERSTRTMQRMEIADGRTGDGIFTEPNAAPTCTRYRENDLERSELALAGERLKSPRDLLRARYRSPNQSGSGNARGEPRGLSNRRGSRKNERERRSERDHGVPGVAR